MRRLYINHLFSQRDKRGQRKPERERDILSGLREQNKTSRWDFSKEHNKGPLASWWAIFESSPRCREENPRTPQPQRHDAYLTVSTAWPDRSVFCWRLTPPLHSCHKGRVGENNSRLFYPTSELVASLATDTHVTSVFCPVWTLYESFRRWRWPVLSWSQHYRRKCCCWRLCCDTGTTCCIQSRQYPSESHC